MLTAAEKTRRKRKEQAIHAYIPPSPYKAAHRLKVNSAGRAAEVFVRIKNYILMPPETFLNLREV